MTRKVAFDLDGTLDLGVWSCWDHIDRSMLFLNPNINPNKVKWVITGRHESMRWRTLEHLAMLGIKPFVLCMNPILNYEPQHIYKMKAHYLMMLDIGVYVDDDPRFKIFMPKYWDGIVIDSTELGRYV
jgi:hypothetical protein